MNHIRFQLLVVSKQRNTFEEMMKHWSLLTLILLISYQVNCNLESAESNINLTYFNDKAKWADNIYNQLSEDDCLGQLFMTACYSRDGEAHLQKIITQVKQDKIGGVIFMQGDPVTQVKWSNQLQAAAEVPLMVSIDGEWGLNMRLKNTTKFPKQMTLGAIQDNDLIWEMGVEIGRQCKRVGVHVNFAPVVDINSNPNNPVIDYRSFGEDKFNVALKGLAYAEGLQEVGVMACAKHFPGHGDTDKDSHLTLPVIKHNRNRLEDIEMYPFKIMAKNGVQSVMAAHLFVPALDNTKNLATSLSRKVTHHLLKDTIGFNGLVFSDALNMKGVSNFYAPGELDAKALIAGNDILLFSQDVKKGKTEIKKAIANGQISADEVKQRVLKVLEAKYDLKLFKDQQLNTENVLSDLNTPYAEALKKRLYAAAITVAQQAPNALPIKDIYASTAVVAIGATKKTAMQFELQQYTNWSMLQLSKQTTAATFNQKINQLKNKKRVIIALHDMNRRNSKNYGLSKASIDFVQQLALQTEVVLVVLGSPYSLKHFSSIPTLVVGYEEVPAAQKAVARALLGIEPALGRLPISANENITVGTGYDLQAIARLPYAEDLKTLKVKSDLPKKIKARMKQAIADKAAPGCQVLVARKGEIIFNDAVGHHSSKRQISNSITDIYDLASITKIAATAISVMRLEEANKIDLNKTISDYLDLPSTSTVGELNLRSLLLHESGLPSWIPFYHATLADSIYDSLYAKESSAKHSVQVADNFYILPEYADTIWHKITHVKLKEKTYRYSDLGMYILRRIIEKVTDQSFETYVAQTFYEPMGLYSMGYRPLQRFHKDLIPPTENDDIFRKQVIDGFVHDPGAAMMGGVEGHAGLFSNAQDLAALMQMLLNGGEIAEQAFLSNQIIERYTKSQHKRNRRGLAFDKPEPLPGKRSPTCPEAGKTVFGHSGFTGTCVWVDPSEDLIYIFLSNRIHPSAKNRKLISTNVRTDIQTLIYESLM